MVTPWVLSWMKEMDNFAGIRVPSGEVRAFVPVAVHARKGEILQAGFAAVLASDDVVYVKGRDVPGCGHVAALAAPLCAIPDATDQVLIHRLRASREDSRPALRRATRARECMTDNTLAMLT